MSKRNVALLVVTVAVALGLLGYWGTRPTTSGTVPVTLLYQSNRLGQLEPCGCEVNPFGGIDREYNAVTALRSQKKNVINIDAGNLLVSKKSLADLGRAQEHALTVAGLVRELKVDVFAPGLRDYALGVETLKKATEVIGAQVVSTNVTDGSGSPVFAPYSVVERGGVRFGFVSTTPKDSGASVSIEDPATALKRYLPEVKAKSDVVVLLSQLPYADIEKFIAPFPEIQIVVGADNSAMFERPVWYRDGARIMVDPNFGGYYLGVLDLDLKLPVAGLYSQERSNEAGEKRTKLQAMLTQPAQAATAKLALERLDRFEPGSVPSEASTYRHQMIALDPKNYGATNALSEKLKEVKTSDKASALKEAIE